MQRKRLYIIITSSMLLIGLLAAAWWGSELIKKISVLISAELVIQVSLKFLGVLKKHKLFLKVCRKNI